MATHVFESLPDTGWYPYAAPEEWGYNQRYHVTVTPHDLNNRLKNQVFLSML